MKTDLKLKTMCFALFLAINFTSCTKDPMDKMLDSYENLLSNWESRTSGKVLQMGQMMDLQQDIMKMNLDPNALRNIMTMDQSKISENQKKRAVELRRRFQKLFLP